MHNDAPFRPLLLLAALLVLAGSTAAQKHNQGNNPGEFDKVDYLFGPTARSLHEKLNGEVATGKLRFDGAAKALFFTTDKGPNLYIPYSRILELALDDKSLMRQGALAAGVVVAPFLRQHKHFLTIRYTDEKGAGRTALLQLDKGNFQEVGNTVQQEFGADDRGASKSANHIEVNAVPKAPGQTATGSSVGRAEHGPAELGVQPAGTDTFLSVQAEAEKVTARDVPALEERARAGDAHGAMVLIIAFSRSLQAAGHDLGVMLDLAEVEKWTQQAAEKGYAPAEYMMGHKSKGAQAAEWYRKAAVQGDPDAQQELGIFYASGDGLKADPMEACRWFHLAAEQGPEFGYSQAMLGLSYAMDPGPRSCVSRDMVEAAKWIRIGVEGLAREKNPIAAQFQEIANALLLSPAESAEADRRLAEFRKRFAVRSTAPGDSPAAPRR
jgi:Sel1 repeat